MGDDSERKIRVCPVEGSNFKEDYQRLLKDNPDIRDALTTFNTCKKKIPPEPLPNGMRDHKLKGRLKDLWECHLSTDILLIYKYDDDIVRLIKICRHDDLR